MLTMKKRGESADSNRFYFSCMFAGGVIVFFISLFYTDVLTSLLVAAALAEIAGWLVMLSVMSVSIGASALRRVWNRI